MKNWVVKKLGEVYDVRDGTHDSPKYVEEGYALITSKNLKNDNLNYDKVNYISEQDYVNINKRSKVDVGDILFAMIGTIGNPIVIKDEPDFAIKNVALFKVPEDQDSYFLKYYLDSGLVIEQMTKDAKGATRRIGQHGKAPGSGNVGRFHMHAAAQGFGLGSGGIGIIDRKIDHPDFRHRLARIAQTRHHAARGTGKLSFELL